MRDLTQLSSHYDVLGITTTATAVEIKEAYHKLALEFHPDKNLENATQAGENFKCVHAAYEILNDPAKKQSYDRKNLKKTTVGRGATKNHVPTVIKTAYDFNAVLSPLSEDQRTAVYNATKDHLPNVMKTASDLNTVHDYLNTAKRTAVYNAIQDHLPNMIKTAYDLGLVLKLLNADQCAKIFIEKKRDLPNLIRTAYYDMNHAIAIVLIKQLETAAVKLFFRGYEIQEGSLGYCRGSQESITLQDITDHARGKDIQGFSSAGADDKTKRSIANTRERLIDVFHVDPGDINKCSVVVTNIFCAASNHAVSRPTFKATFHGHSFDNLLVIFQHLPPGEITEILKLGNAAAEIAKEIQTIENLVMLILNSNLENLTVLLGNQEIQQLIKSTKDLCATLRSLSCEQTTVVCDAMKNHLTNLIKTPWDLATAFLNLDENQRTAVYNAMKDQLPDMIKTLDDLGLVLRLFNADQCTEICIAKKKDLPNLSKTETEMRLQ